MHTLRWRCTDFFSTKKWKKQGVDILTGTPVQYYAIYCNCPTTNTTSVKVIFLDLRMFIHLADHSLLGCGIWIVFYPILCFCNIWYYSNWYSCYCVHLLYFFQKNASCAPPFLYFLLEWDPQNIKYINWIYIHNFKYIKHLKSANSMSSWPKHFISKYSQFRQGFWIHLITHELILITEFNLCDILQICPQF